MSIVTAIDGRKKSLPMAQRPDSIRLLIVDDDEALRETLARRFEKQGMQVATAASGEELLGGDPPPCDIALLDLNMPGMTGLELLEKLKEIQPEIEAIMLTGHGSIETAIQAMKKGAYDYLTKPFHFPELEVHIQKAFEKVRLARRERQWADHLDYESARYKLVGSTPAMQRVTQLIQKVAPTDSTVLIRGASGTGKELVARAIHFNSKRRQRPIVTINCAALQETLLESELFGHEKGAFTGATTTKAGLVEVAEGGTLFIDEIGEMAAGLQAKLLRILEDGHFRRVGSIHEHHADVRVVAATNRPLEDEIKEGKFREDLFYRLNVVTIDLPPLRERRADIPLLVEHFLATRGIGAQRFQIEPDALKAITQYAWPGNIRELANVLERAQILAENQHITLDDLPETIVEAAPAETGAESAADASDLLRDVERRHVREVLKQEKGNKVHAAKVLGISRRALYRLLHKYKIQDE
ncbi:MAG: sigma-54 dependent transcriptional regulator [Gemmataceae bacterium]